MSGFNFASRPFRNERPVLLSAGTALAVAAVLFLINVRLYVGYQKSVAGTSQQIEYLQGRKTQALRRSGEARVALDSYRVSNLATESQGLLKIVAERRFSWTTLLARLERVLPAEVRVSRLTPRFDGEIVHVSMALVGKDAESVVKTIAALARDPVFSEIDLRSEQTQEQGVPEGRSFDVDARYLAAAPLGDRSR